MSFLIDAQFQEQPLAILSTYNSYSPTSGSLLTSGGLGVKLSAHVGEQLTVNSVNVTPSLGDIIYERQDTLQNNIITQEPISNFIFYNDKTQTFNAIISIDVINLVNSALNKTALLEMTGSLGPSGWTLNNRFTGDLTGVRFFIQNVVITGNNAGQIYYTNSNLVGTTTTIRFKANTISPTGASNDSGPYSSTPVNLEASNVEYTMTNIGDWGSSPTNIQQAIDHIASELKNISFENEIYVSKNGNDSSGNGSINSPFLTISAAITQVNSYADNVPIILNISPGVYSESITIVKPNIHLKGSSIGSTKMTRMDGTLTINPRSSTGGMYANYYTFENISFVGSSNNVFEYTGSHTGSLYIKDCMIYTDNINVKGLSFTNTTSMKVIVFDTDINLSGSSSSSNQSAVYTAAGSAVIASFNNCNIYGRIAPAVSVNGSSNMSFNRCYISNTGNDVIELKNSVVSYFTQCTISNSQLNSNGFNISNSTNLVLSHCVFNIPTNVVYNPLNPGSPPGSTDNYVIKGSGSMGSSVIYGACIFSPISAVGVSYYWGSRAISNTVSLISYNTTLTSQA
jgi:hypothetical protein